MPVHQDGGSKYGVYNTPLVNFCCVRIRCNNALLRLIVPCRKQRSTHFKLHSNAVFRLNDITVDKKSLYCHIRCFLTENICRESVGIKANLFRHWDNGSYFLNFSLHSFTMCLKIEKICARSPIWLATIVYVRQTPEF